MSLVVVLILRCAGLYSAPKTSVNSICIILYISTLVVVIIVAISTELQSLLDIHGLQQHVSSPTRRTPDPNSLLDLVISSSNNISSTPVSSVTVIPSHYISDHDLVTFSLSSKSQIKRTTTTYSFRKLANMDVQAFRDDLTDFELFTSPVDTADELAEQIDQVTSAILDKHCSLQTRTKLTPTKPDNRWLTPEALAAKRLRCRLERRWKKHQRESDRQAYRKACRSANRAITESRTKFYCERVQAAGKDCRSRWSAIKDILHLASPPDSSSVDYNQHICDSFATFFQNKIVNLKTSLTMKLAHSPPNSLFADKPHMSEPLSAITPPSADEVLKLIRSMPAKSSPMDSIPTSVIKLCPDIFATLITRLATISFRDGAFHSIY